MAERRAPPVASPWASLCRRVRGERHWTQAALAHYCGVARSTVHAWENRGHTPGGTAALLLQALTTLAVVPLAVGFACAPPDIGPGDLHLTRADDGRVTVVDRVSGVTGHGRDCEAACAAFQTARTAWWTQTRGRAP